MAANKKRLKTLCVDFDGVLNSYKSGWRGPRTLPDPPVDGAIKWLESLLGVPEGVCAMYQEPPKFRVCIFSSRNRYFGARRAMRKWLLKHGLHPGYLGMIEFPTRKPPAHFILDDRAKRFEGEFPTIEEMQTFRPWNRRKRR